MFCFEQLLNKKASLNDWLFYWGVFNGVSVFSAYFFIVRLKVITCLHAPLITKVVNLLRVLLLRWIRSCKTQSRH